MSWYYLDNGQQAGPLSEDEFRQAVNGGAIQDETLIWQDGMGEWQPYGKTPEAQQLMTVAPAAAGAAGGNPFQQNIPANAGDYDSCQTCGAQAPGGDVVAVGRKLVCSQCKNRFVQQVREGVSETAMEYAGFWIRVGAKVIDGFIMIVAIIGVLVIAGLVMGMTASSGLVNPDGTIDPAAEAMLTLVIMIVYVALPVLYNVILQGGKHQATWGKRAVGIRVIRDDGGDISYGRAFGRVLSEWVSGMVMYIGYIMVAFDDEKRALHDHMCSTRVIIKKK